MSRGENDQPRFFLFISIFIAAGIIVGILVTIMLSTSANTSKVVLKEQEKYTLYSNTVVQGLFSIVSLRFADSEGASCTLADSYQRPAIMTMRFQAYQVPDSCDIFVNSKYLRTERKLDPDCSIACDFQEFNRQFSLGDFDYRDDHRIRVCCNDICLEKSLDALCSTPVTS